MKSFLLSVLIVSLLSITNLYSQDIKAKLKGHLAVNGFTVVDDNGKILFRVTGEGNVGINTDTPAGLFDIEGDIDNPIPRSILLKADGDDVSGNPGGNVTIRSGGGYTGGTIQLWAGYGKIGGNVEIQSGGGEVCAGDINLTANSSNLDGGNINIKTTGNKGRNAINLETGGGGIAGVCEITLKTGNGGEAVESNNRIFLSTGNSIAGNNSIELRTGVNEYVGTNDIVLATGNGTIDGKAGDIVFTPGTGTPDGKVIINGSGTYTGTWAQASDERFKKNIEPLHNAVDKLEQLNGVSYELKSDEFPEKNFADGRQIGLIAQEVEKVFPELVKTDAEGYKSVAYQNMVAVLLEAVKEQQKSIDELKEEVSELNTRLNIEISAVTELNFKQGK